jgi:hypothetical protein
MNSALSSIIIIFYISHVLKLLMSNKRPISLLGKISGFLFVSSFLLVSCKKDDIKDDSAKLQNQSAENADIATRWADMTLYTIKYAAKNSPTYSSRALGYIGLAMYEAVVNADPNKRSMSGQLSGLTNLPVPQASASYYWPLALNAAEASLLKYLYPNPAVSPPSSISKIDSLYNLIFREKSRGLSAATVDRSVEFGKSLASKIYEWSKADGGDVGYSKHFDPAYTFPSGNSYWIPPTAGQTVSNYPLHPYWGQNRTFATTNGALATPAIVPYSTDVNSAYYKLYNDVYQKNKILTQQEKEIAAWWADDPTQTYSPPGHSYNIATIIIKKANANIIKAAETYARVGMSLADAFICCWKTKVAYFNERPSSYVRKNIDANWTQYWPEPPFPAFPSGHSTQGAAMATVLTDLYGDNFSFTDNTHMGLFLPPYTTALTTRTFTNIWASAEECAYSRFLGGIHTQQDNDTGIAEGTKIGANINNLVWKK